MGLTDNIRDFFRQQGEQETKAYSSFPNNQVVFPFNTDIGFFSGVDQMSPEGNSAALACLNVLGTAFSEPPLEVYQTTGDGKEQILNHPASMLMKKPSPYMSGNLLNQYIVASVSVAGDAFILKLRSEAGDVVQLYPLIPEQVDVKGTKEELITHYEYKQKGQNMYIPREDMIHIRERIDPRNHRRGLAPLRSVMVEILGDSAASQMASALVKNMGVPGVVISPKNDLSMSGEEAENIAEVFGRRFGGENRGKPLVVSGGEIDVQTLSFSPKDLEIGSLRHVNEERISAVLGIPAILAGLGAGLASSTYANVSELRNFFTEQKLIPMWKNVAQDLTNQLLLADFTDELNYSMMYDLSDVRALQSDEALEMDKVVKGLQAGFVTIAEARKAITTDLNNFAGWKQGLSAEDKATAEVAKRALLRANSVFARLSPIYKSQAAKKFKLIDENMFSPGPELPGWNYSDELYNIVMSKKITPQAINQVKELIGQEAFDSVTRTWLNEGLKNSLRRNNPIDLMVDAPSARGTRPKRIMVTDYAVDPDALLQNIGFDQPGFEAMIDAAGLNGKVVKDNIKNLVEIARKIEGQDIGNPFALVKRRIALGGIRTGFKTFSFGAAAGVGGGAAVFGPAPVIAGLLARYTADFLSSPNVLKNYSQVIDDTASMAVKRAAYTNILRDFYKQMRTGDRLEEFPDEFKTYQGVLENPGGFSDWLFGAGFDSAMAPVGEPGAQQSYQNKRYGNSDAGLNLSSYVTSDVEEADSDKIVSSTNVKEQTTINVPNVPSMGSESVIPDTAVADIAQAAVPTAPVNLNRDQRAALASDDIDAAIALGQG